MILERSFRRMFTGESNVGLRRPEVTYGTDANRDERQARAAHWRHNEHRPRRDCVVFEDRTVR